MKFEAPIVEIKKFDLFDILTTSGGGGGGDVETSSVFGIEDCGPCNDT